MKKSKDIIKDDKGLNVMIKHKNTSESSRIFCDKIEYIHDRGKFMDNPIFDHHLYFWEKGKLIFKVWLRNKPSNKEYKDIYSALKDVGIKIIPNS